jgi:uncharacterized protein YbjQ (UPF0145 family)
MLMTTTDTIANWEIGTIFGIVIGTEACTRNKFDAGMKALDDAAEVDRAQALLRSRRIALNRMAEQAGAWGANAVLGVRFEHREVSGTWIEVCAYGTAATIWETPQ